MWLVAGRLIDIHWMTPTAAVFAGDIPNDRDAMLLCTRFGPSAGHSHDPLQGTDHHFLVDPEFGSLPTAYGYCHGIHNEANTLSNRYRLFVFSHASK